MTAATSIINQIRSAGSMEECKRAYGNARTAYIGDAISVWDYHAARHAFHARTGEILAARPAKKRCV